MEMENLEVYLDSSQVIFGPFASFVVRRQTLCTTMRIPLLVETLSSPSCSTYKSVTRKNHYLNFAKFSNQYHYSLALI